MPVTEKPFTGLTGSVKLGAAGVSGVVAYISGIDLDLDKEIIEVIQFGGSGYKEKVPAIKNWKASIDGTAAFASTGNQKVLYDAFESGASIILCTYLDPTNFFQGTAYIKSIKISAAADDKCSLSMELEGSGALVLTIP